jgi:hypothetical protein
LRRISIGGIVIVLGGPQQKALFRQGRTYAGD